MPQSAAAAVAAAAVSAGGGPAGFIRTTLPSGGPNPLLPSSALPPVGPYFPKVGFQSAFDLRNKWWSIQCQ